MQCYGTMAKETHSGCMVLFLSILPHFLRFVNEKTEKFLCCTALFCAFENFEVDIGFSTSASQSARVFVGGTSATGRREHI